VATAATFKAVSARLHSPSFKITLQEQISDPGKLTWRLTFKNGTLGVFSARSKCKSGSVRLGGKCRPAQVVYGRGSATFASAGVVTITINPSNAAKKALRVAMQRKRNMRITALVTFLPTKGGASVSHTQVLTVRFATAR
jgi:hypothetical protein